MSRSWISPSVAALGFVLIAILAVHDLVRDRPLNVIVLTVESWREDSVLHENLPHLLLESGPHGVRFTNHRTVSAWTAPNVIALLSGLSPFDQGAHTRGDSVPAELDTITEEFARNGWLVAGLQSFMTIDLFKNLGLALEPGVELKHWLASRARDRRPFYLWYHYLGTHLPYQQHFSAGDDLVKPAVDGNPDLAARVTAVTTQPVVPEGSIDFSDGDRPWVESAYIGGVRDFDEWFAEFWRFFNRTGLRENTILVVTADHGEELLERGNVGHASTTRAAHLHEEIVRVPLFVWLPPGMLDIPRGTVFTHPTDHNMIAPMLAKLAGLRGNGGGDTKEVRDGFPAWLPPTKRIWTAITSVAGFSEPDPGEVTKFVAAARDGDMKVQVQIGDGRIVGVEAWDLDADPDELSPLAGDDPRVAPLRRHLEDEVASMRVRTVRNSDDAGGTGGPRWVHPGADGQIRYADIADTAYLAWTGDAGATHIVAYEAGTGLLTLDGEIEVEGTRYDFGRIEESYWSTWIVPYGKARFRVRRADAEGRWSDWMELEFAR
ncbi:MAG: sulfatase-like hydrolase/transferase [Rhodospirillaceae bacterium]|jgi:arylsulfatase A-like enzyme|nr:sulfatase-like hydrolase/transferase [Rhodospirillaceae bacterium]MBT5358498.1 sulfatase-like hydrolase/transferase [Rhodospirillaceae bacterium]MBT5770635.1 sulfatase-like hydrolase/transferase [Rhodospirillaceae bacterium]MBT6309059.1 sulfatase-like hydrolase/transferase [Rhodospirillaceae bacterium]MBT7364754.1 sulfatase-like hydrolase/transferase [Rhodospirillaceae bacterium]